MRNSIENRNNSVAIWRRGALAALSLGLAVFLTLAPSTALAASDGGNEAVVNVEAAPAPTTSTSPDASAEGGTDDAVSSEAGAEKTYSVTIYHSEMMFYDDPAFVPEDDPRYEGFRLMQAVTIDGFKAGDVVNAWDYVGTAKGFTFFDGWPRELVVSEDESKNVLQLNYFRDTSDCVVNHYVLYDRNAPLPMQSGGLPLPLEALDSSSIAVAKVHEEELSNQLFGNLLTSEDYADANKLPNPSNPNELLEGMTLVGSYPSQMYVSTDEKRNEISLFYAAASASLPDESPVDPDDPGVNGDNSEEGDGSSGEGGFEGDDSGSGLEGDGSSDEGNEGADDSNGPVGGAESGDGPSTTAPADDAADIGSDNPDGAAELSAKVLPTTGDNASGMASLPMVMGCALAGALFARSQRAKA